MADSHPRELSGVDGGDTVRSLECMACQARSVSDFSTTYLVGSITLGIRDGNAPESCTRNDRFHLQATGVQCGKRPRWNRSGTGQTLGGRRKDTSRVRFLERPVCSRSGPLFRYREQSIADYVTPLGMNRWPVEDCASVFADFDSLVESARLVAFDSDGAVVVNSDGTIEEKMVRLSQLSDTELELLDGLPYADWMGTRHMSALETSTRDEVAAVITLSEEDGRITIFTDGTFRTHHRTDRG